MKFTITPIIRKVHGEWVSNLPNPSILGAEKSAGCGKEAMSKHGLRNSGC
jgi:hypothetical protein